MTKKDKPIKHKLPFNTEGKIIEGAAIKTPEQRKQEFEKLSQDIDNWIRQLKNEDK